MQTMLLLPSLFFIRFRQLRFGFFGPVSKTSREGCLWHLCPHIPLKKFHPLIQQHSGTNFVEDMNIKSYINVQKVSSWLPYSSIFNPLKIPSKDKMREILPFPHFAAPFHINIPLMSKFVACLIETHWICGSFLQLDIKGSFLWSKLAVGLLLAKTKLSLNCIIKYN